MCLKSQNLLFSSVKDQLEPCASFSFDSSSLAFAGMPRAEARGGTAISDRDVTRRAKTGGFGGVPLGFATDAPRGSAGSLTCLRQGSHFPADRATLEHGAPCVRPR